MINHSCTIILQVIKSRYDPRLNVSDRVPFIFHFSWTLTLFFSTKVHSDFTSLVSGLFLNLFFALLSVTTLTISIVLYLQAHTFCYLLNGLRNPSNFLGCPSHAHTFAGSVIFLHPILELLTISWVWLKDRLYINCSSIDLLFPLSFAASWPAFPDQICNFSELGFFQKYTLMLVNQPDTQELIQK